MAKTIDEQNFKKKKMAAKAALAAAVGAVALSSEANAAETDAQMVDVSSLNNVVSTRRLDDGTLEIVLNNGEVVHLGSDAFIEQGGQFLLTPEALAQFTNDNGILIVGAVVAAAAGIALIASGGGDDDPEPAPIDPNIPTAGDDVVQGSPSADTINGLAGNDTISGLGGDDTLNGDAGNDTLNGDAGNDTLNGNAGNDTLRGGDGDDVLAGGGGTDVIEGGDGIDTNSFEGIGSGVTATVAADGTGTADYGQVNETFTGIENLRGSDNDDVLIATGAAANTIEGGAGDDLIAGGGGTDILDGGEGNDTNSFQGISGDVTASLVDETASYGMVNETFTNFENLTGGSGNDTLTGDMNANILDGAEGNDTLIGGGGADTLTGGAGDDVLVGGGGADIIDGGEGIDTNSFEGIGLGVTATVAADGTGTADYGMVNETFTGIENLRGSDNDDVLIATGAAANTIEGGAGDDLIAGGGGTDILDGGEGNDTNSFQGISGDVTASLVDGTASYGMVNETFTNFENLTGGSGDDTLTGDATDNVLSGAVGDDTLIGGAGNNTLDGGEGFDTVDYSTSAVPVIVDLDENGNGTATRESGFSVEVVDAQVADDATFVQAATDGNLYFNVHTEEFGGGEIRGQLSVTSDETVDGVRTIVLDATLDAAQEPMDASDSDATGTGQVTITVDADGNATYSSTLDIEGISPSELITLGNGALSAIHLHNAPAGQNGPVLQDVIVDAGGDVEGNSGFEVSVEMAEVADDATFIAAADAGNLYFNVHTADFPGGEIRGQLDTVVSDETVDGVRTLVLSASLDGAQEPMDASDSEATGVATVTIVIDADGNATYSSDLAVEGINVDDLITLGNGALSAIHLHNAPAGENGPVLQDIIVDAGGTTTDFSVLSETDVIDEVTEVDQLISIENVILSENNDVLNPAAGNQSVDGGAGDDVLLGGGGNDTLTGGAGDDLIAGGGGTDIIDGGEGIDTNSFAGIGVGVTATVAADGTGTADYGMVNETFAGIENLLGSDNNDVLIATGAAANTIEGGAGDDLIAGGGGTDILDGGAGNDTNSFQGIGGNVTASLVDGTASYGMVNETFTNFENLTGGSGDDTLTGDATDNVLSGAVGDDTLIGGLGDDTLDGGEGFDTADYSDVDVPIIVALDADGNGTVTRTTGFSVEVVDAQVADDATFVQAATDGNLYFNVHTDEFGGGEIRGQLSVSSDETVNGVRTIVLDGDLDAAQEPMDASDSDATGTGQVIITVDADGNATYSSTLNIEGIAPSELITLGNGALSAIHLHNAPAGQNGPVLQDVIVDAGADVTGLALSPAADTGDGNVFDEVVEVDTLLSIEEVIDQDGMVVSASSAATSSSAAQAPAVLQSVEVEGTPTFEPLEAGDEFDFVAEFADNVDFNEDGAAVFIQDMFEIA